MPLPMAPSLTAVVRPLSCGLNSSQRQWFELMDRQTPCEHFSSFSYQQRLTRLYMTFLIKSQTLRL